MNPVSFYYCYHEDGVALHSIVAEINNTPWNEQFAYVLPCVNGRAPQSPRHHFQFKKSFHVSPFMAMDYDYDWRFSTPDKRLSVHMINRKQGREPFDSTMVLTRREISTRVLASDLVRHSFMTLKVFAAIYFQAARLWIKRCASFSHP